MGLGMYLLSLIVGHAPVLSCPHTLCRVHEHIVSLELF